MSRHRWVFLTLAACGAAPVTTPGTPPAASDREATLPRDPGPRAPPPATPNAGAPDAAERAAPSGRPGDGSASPDSGAPTMAQGEASIARGSHVEMRVEHGTSGPEIDLGPVAAAWRDGLRTIRECYAALVATEPSVVGTMSIALSWRGARARPDIAFAAGSLDHSALVPCTRRALGGALPADAPRAGSVHVTLEFSNTAAAGVAISEGRREASRDGLAVTRGPGDRRSVRGQTLQGEVSYEVWATGGADDDAVRAAADMVRTSVGLLLDCRRKAGRRGRSPAGRIALSLDAGARGAATVVESSVAAPDAGPCAARAATTMGLRPPAGATLGLTIDFAPAP